MEQRHTTIFIPDKNPDMLLIIFVISENHPRRRPIASSSSSIR